MVCGLECFLDTDAIMESITKEAHKTSGVRFPEGTGMGNGATGSG